MEFWEADLKEPTQHVNSRGTHPKCDFFHQLASFTSFTFIFWSNFGLGLEGGHILFQLPVIFINFLILHFAHKIIPTTSASEKIIPKQVRLIRF